MKFKAIIFDLDGTLINTIDDIGDSMNRILKMNNIPPHSIDVYKTIVGRGLKKMVEQALPIEKRGKENINIYLNKMLIEYSEKSVVKTKTYPGIPDLLDKLQEIKIKKSILSNKDDFIVQEIVERILKNWNFSTVCGAFASVPLKPDPSSALKTAKIMKTIPEEILFIGDSEVDIQTACNAGMFPAGVLWGYSCAAVMKENGARILFSEPSEILDFLKKV